MLTNGYQMGLQVSPAASANPDAEFLDQLKVTEERDEARAEVERVKAKHAAMGDDYKRDLHRMEVQRIKLQVVHAGRDDVWFWQGQGDEPGSLSCPVVMSADTLREILAERDAAMWEVERMRASRRVASGDRDEAFALLDTMEDERNTARAEVERITKERDDAREERDEWRDIADGLAGVGMERFARAMGWSRREDDLDASVTPEKVNAEHVALAEGIKRLRPEWDVMRAEVERMRAQLEGIRVYVRDGLGDDETIAALASIPGNVRATLLALTGRGEEG